MNESNTRYVCLLKDINAWNQRIKAQIFTYKASTNKTNKKSELATWSTDRNVFNNKYARCIGAMELLISWHSNAASVQCEYLRRRG